MKPNACRMPAPAPRSEAEIYRSIRDVVIRSHCERKAGPPQCCGAISSGADDERRRLVTCRSDEVRVDQVDEVGFAEPIVLLARDRFYGRAVVLENLVHGFTWRPEDVLERLIEDTARDFPLLVDIPHRKPDMGQRLGFDLSWLIYVFERHPRRPLRGRSAGLNTMLAAPSNRAWLPTPEEVALIAAGAPIYLGVLGISHPPVSLSVGDPPAEDGAQAEHQS